MNDYIDSKQYSFPKEAEYEPDNIIQWIFEKIFDQLTTTTGEIYSIPFDTIRTKTFDNNNLYELINKLSNRHFDQIKEYLTNKKFQEKFLFNKIKKKLHVSILLNDFDKIKYLIEYGYQIDANSLLLAVLNNRLEMLKLMLESNKKIKLHNELLIYCSEFGYEEMYFFLREVGLVPNISVFNKAVLGGSIRIIMDVNKIIGLSDKILTSVFQTNNTDAILFLIKEAIKDGINIDENLITYPILNSNFILINELSNMGLVRWHYELYYSAILSGSLETISYLEQKLPTIHDDRILDTGKCKKGRTSILLPDMIYQINNKKYFSHTMNYAIQSESLEMVKYIFLKGYQITPSNFITAIKQGTIEMIEYLCQNYTKKLPDYILHYFGTNSFVNNKMKKAQIIINYGLLDINSVQINNMQNLKKESIHIEMISQNIQVPEDGNIDPDYLLKYQLFFVPSKGFKINYRLCTLVRVCLELDLQNELENIINNTTKNEVDKQFIIDVLYLFGNITQIKKYHQLISLLICPSQQIIMEIICYCQISKLCYLLNNNLLTDNMVNNIYPLATVLSDNFLDLFFKKLVIPKPQFKFILLSGNKRNMITWLKNNANNGKILLDKSTLKNILLLDDISIVKKINIPNKLLDELIIWSEESDLLEIKNYLQSI